MIDYPLAQTKLKLKAIINSPHYKIYAPHMKNIMEIAVDSRYKRQGIETALLTKIEWAKERGAQGVRLVLRAKKCSCNLSFYGPNKQQINFKKKFDEVTEE